MDIYSKQKRSEMMSRVRVANTKPEMIVRRKLHSLGFRFRLHRKELPGKPDIVLTKHRAVIFVHGCFWHQHESCSKAKPPSSNVEFWENKLKENMRRDFRNVSELKRLGWHVLIVWECETKNDKYIKSVNDFLNSRKASSAAKST